MKRTLVYYLFALALVVPQAQAQDIEILNGLITANQVDVTADDGSLLAERLSVGDTVYIIDNPNDQRKGWVRITRSPDDLTGIGWVETKHIRTFSRYKTVKTGGDAPDPAIEKGEKTVFTPDVEKRKYKKVGVVPFTFSDPDDPIGRFAIDAFSLSLKNEGSFELTSANLKNVDPESSLELQKMTETHGLDGVFVGKLSDKVAGARLLQVKFYGKDRSGFILEKVKRLPSEGNLQNVIQELVRDVSKMLLSE